WLGPPTTITMKSPSWTTLLPTGGFSRWRCSSIQACRLIGLGSMGSSSVAGDGDALELDRDRRRQRGGPDRGAAGRQCRIRKVLGPHCIVGAEIAAHVGQEHGHV